MAECSSRVPTAYVAHSGPRERCQPGARSTVCQSRREPLLDDRVDRPASRERPADLALSHAAGTHVAGLVLVEAEQEVAGTGPERRMEAPLEPDAVGIGERVE